MGRLYIVATPIGNLGDITVRAVEILKTCRIVFCEDTRHTRKLMSHLGIPTPLAGCRGQNASQCVPRVIEFLAQDADIAYVSDAGTPGISDPGSQLVRAAREAGHAVVPIPGPSAVTSLASVSGVPGRSWLFEGFLPPKGGRRLKRLEELAGRREPFILYESPHRVEKLFQELSRAAAGYKVVLGRELTKLHEQIVVDGVEEVTLKLADGRITRKGEFVILVWPGKSR